MQQSGGRFSLNIFFMLGVVLIFSGTTLYPSPRNAPNPGTENLLEKIYREVLELSASDNQEFIKKEFHFDLDGNEANKEEHVVVLSHDLKGWRELIIQVTYFENARPNSYVKYAKRFDLIHCDKRDGIFRIRECSYPENERGKILSTILSGIREEKQLLKMLDKKKRSDDTPSPY